MFFVYILKSEVDGSFYIGYTSDLAKRLKEHNEGLSVYSSRKKPWIVVYYEKFEVKSEALKREKFLKKQKNREFYTRLMEEFVFKDR